MDYDSDAQERKTPYLTTVWAAIASVGWYVLAVAIALWYVSPYFIEKYVSWKQKKEERDYAAKYHKDPDLLRERLSQMEASRQRMQEEYYQKTLLANEREKERKEKKKQEVAKLMNQDLGGRQLGETDDSPSSSTETKSKPLRREYNPLMGDNSRGYRPPKRSCCSKGGCS